MEALLAEALGPACSLVSSGWHPWDLQFGPVNRPLPDRIRIQVKNTAALQTWSKAGHKSERQWVLACKPVPPYFREANPDIPCEGKGYLCDVFILADHPEHLPEQANHLDPYQWRFFVVPVTEIHNLFPLDIAHGAGKDRWSYVVRPESLERGIRGRPPVRGVGIGELTEPYIREQLSRQDFLRPQS